MTLRQIELTSNFGRVQPGRAAKGEQRRMPRIDATTHRDEPYSLGHIGVDDAVNALRRRQPADAKSCGDAVDRGFRGGAIEPTPATQETLRIEIAQH